MVEDSPIGEISVVSSKEMDVEMTTFEEAGASEQPSPKSGVDSPIYTQPRDRATSAIFVIDEEPVDDDESSSRRSSNIHRQKRCSTLKCVCLLTFLACFVCVVTLNYWIPCPHLLNLDVNDSWYLRREDWKAQPAKSLDYWTLPLRRVIVGHTSKPACNSREQCIVFLRHLQEKSFKRGYDDVTPNFFLGGNGLLFEGRGANLLGSQVKTYNSQSIAIVFIGDYRGEEVDMRNINRTHSLLETLVRQNVLTDDYVIYAKCQVTPNTTSPSLKLVQALKQNFKHWEPLNVAQCHNGGRND